MELFEDIPIFEDQEGDILQLLGEDEAPTDIYYSLMDKLDAVIENQSDVSSKLDTVIEGQAAISNALYSILGLSILGIGFKILWTVIAKWLFGGI